MDTVTVIAGGPSAAAVPLERVAGYVIGVNEAGLLAPRVDVVLSMDRLWTEHRWGQLVTRCGPTWIRRSAIQNLRDRWDELRIFECDHLSTTFSQVPGWLNGTHSGFCALNLAYNLRPRRLFMIGFDMARAPGRAANWHKPHEFASATGSTSDGKYRQWAGQFQWAARAFQGIGCSVFNVSPKSAIADFPKITPKQYLQELSR